MTAPHKTLRYQLPHKALKGDCPQCAPRYRKTLSRYVDTRTGEPLPAEYGRCDRENNCTYHLSPYYKGQSGISYADEVFEQWKANNPLLQKRTTPWADSQPLARTTDTENRPKRGFSNAYNPLQVTPPPSSATEPVYCIPDSMFRQSVGHYERNQLASLLRGIFGDEQADQLLQRFQIGTSSHWPGACIFWYIDEQGRVRGGQIKLLASNWHTVRYVDHEGVKRTKTNWVHTVLKRRLDKAGEPLPAWLEAYGQNGSVSPCLFGLPQLQTAPVDQPIAIVEAPKTAIIATAYFPEFLWLAVGAKSYLTAERLAPLKNRSLLLWPDLDAFTDKITPQGNAVKGWASRAAELRALGFDIEVSDFLERHATDEQREQGLDLADFLLELPPGGRDEQLVGKTTPQIEPVPELPHWYTAFNLPWQWDALGTLARIRWMVLPMGVTEGSPQDTAANPTHSPSVVASLVEWAATPGSRLQPPISQLQYL